MLITRIQKNILVQTPVQLAPVGLVEADKWVLGQLPRYPGIQRTLVLDLEHFQPDRQALSAALQTLNQRQLEFMVGHVVVLFANQHQRHRAQFGHQLRHVNTLAVLNAQCVVDAAAAQGQATEQREGR
ncbi:hypothetical protein GALL_545880 [mine drainage metagenome]|uniref:Uncharacterized protein n=1 Tax=mine drainage metagenome TaxID=410659 RepID=A0A1J5PK10_9ZZZZ